MLAQASGIESPTREDLAKLDRQRPKKGSNQEWKNPHDPDAKITKMKDGRTHLAHKAEHAVDLETGGMRRTHLRGHARILKRLLVHVAGCNLGLLMRRRFGIGTPRGLQGLVFDLPGAWVRLVRSFWWADTLVRDALRVLHTPQGAWPAAMTKPAFFVTSSTG